jgi:predicted nuclease of predicted toxin-antitoxin system
MKLLANENFPKASVKLFREKGYDITYISEYKGGITDEEVMQIAIREGRTILTFDKDYGELIYKHGYKPMQGVIFLRLFDFNPEEPSELLMKLFENNEFSFEGFFTVVDNNAVRQRKIPDNKTK